MEIVFIAQNLHLVPDALGRIKVVYSCTVVTFIRIFHTLGRENNDGAASARQTFVHPFCLCPTLIILSAVEEKDNTALLITVLNDSQRNSGNVVKFTLENS